MSKQPGLSLVWSKPQWGIGVGLLTVLLLAPFLWAMVKLPGLHERACVIGSSLTVGNVLFSLYMAVASALIFFGLWILHKRRAFRLSVVAGGSVGGVVGFLSVFCTLCTLPVISLFGFSVGLGFFTTYAPMLKAISASLMAFIVWWVDQKIKDCESCA